LLSIYITVISFGMEGYMYHLFYSPILSL